MKRGWGGGGWWAVGGLLWVLVGRGLWFDLRSYVKGICSLEDGAGCGLILCKRTMLFSKSKNSRNLRRQKS